MTSPLSQFACAIYEPNDWIEIRTLRSPDARKFWVPARRLVDQVARLEELNTEGFNVYVGANPRKAKSESGDQAVTLCRCLCADFDDIPSGAAFSPSDIALATIDEAELPQPTVVVHSGHGVHVYWRLIEPIGPSRWHELQQRLNATLGSDPSIKNPERLMRLPGFKNTKAEPWTDCTLVAVDTALVYALDDIELHLVALPEGEPETHPVAQTSGKRPGPFEHKARAMLYAAKWPAVVEGGGRNNAAYAHACALRRDFDLPDGDAWELLANWNAGNNPPLSDRELRHAFESAAKYGRRPSGSKLNKPGRARAGAGQSATPEPEPDALGDLDRYVDDVATGRLRTVGWPWFHLGDGTQALQPGTVTVLSGGPGAAKSLFMLQAIRHWLSTGETVSYFGMEGQRVKYLMRCLAQLAGKSELTRTDYVKANAGEVRRLRQQYAGDLEAFASCLRVSEELGADTLEQVGSWIRKQAVQGNRIIVVDPVTMALRTNKPWVADQQFVRHALNVAREYLCNIVMVTHPEKGVEDPNLQNVAGGASYGRFSDNVFTLKRHEEMRAASCTTQMGRSDGQYNQTICIAKAREGKLVGRRLAFRFSGKSLTTREIGVIVKDHGVVDASDRPY